MDASHHVSWISEPTKQFTVSTSSPIEIRHPVLFVTLRRESMVVGIGRRILLPTPLTISDQSVSIWFHGIRPSYGLLATALLLTQVCMQGYLRSALHLA